MKKQPVNDELPVTNMRDSLPFILCLPIIGERAVLDFVNTVDWRLRPEKRRDALVTYSDLLAFSLRSNIITVEQYNELAKLALTSPLEAEEVLVQARDFRDALTSLLDTISSQAHSLERAGPSAEALSAIHSSLIRAQGTAALVWEGHHLAYRGRMENDALSYPWLAIVRDAEELLRSQQASQIRICEAEGCGWAFIDNSKNGSRRWCSMQLCGNRLKSSRFRSRLSE